ncbi:MAG: hypothetical protein AB1486_35065 [Planctomycetota bacterium]
MRSPELSLIVAPGSRAAYDVLARVGIQRFMECRQCGEIAVELSRRHGIEVAPRTVSHLAQKFVAYVVVVHQDSTELLRRDMRERGGYILHIDGTCEEGSRVALVCMDSLSGQVLESRKIGSESSEEVQAVLQDVRRDWGRPLAIVHDLRQSLITAAGEEFKGVPQFVCHYHLAADVGKDILLPHADRLRHLIRRTQVRSKLRALVRSLKDSAVSKESGELTVAPVLGLRSTTKLRQQCSPELARGTAHALASWILAFSRTGEGYGFPFDMPYLTLYERIIEVHRVLSLATNPWSQRNRSPRAPLLRLKDILAAVAASEHTEEIRRIVAETRTDRQIFQRFRTALKICPKGGKNRRNDEGAPSGLSPRRHELLLRNLRDALKRRMRQDDPAQRTSRIVVEHLDKYWDFLFGHVMVHESRTIIVPRTNNVEERLFRVVKSQCRRLHGRGHLSRDIDAMLPAAPLVLNLRVPDYCQTVYGGQEIDNLAARFRLVDPARPAELLESWRRDKLPVRIPRKLETESRLPQKLAPFIAVAMRELRS